MEPRRATAGQGARWLAEGWRAFAASPGMWIVLVVVWSLILVAVQLVPFVGMLAGLLIMPALSGGMLLCVRDSLTARPLDIGRLFDPLTDPAMRGGMLVLGALFLVANLVVLVLAGLAMMGTVGMTLLGHHEAILGPGGPRTGAMDPGVAMQMGLGLGLGALLAIALSLLVWVLFFYAIPLVLFAQAEPAAAIAASVRAVLRNWLALLVLSVLWTVLAVLATVPLGLGWLVLLPVTFGAWHASWRDVFPGTGAGADAPGPGAVPATADD